MRLSVATLAILLLSPCASPCSASTVSQTQLTGVKGVYVRVLIIDLANAGARSLEKDLQGIANTVVKQQDMVPPRGSDHLLFVTIVLRSIAGCDSRVVVSIETLFADGDLQLSRNPKVQSPRSFVSWYSFVATAEPRDGLSRYLKRVTNNSVREFISDIPDHRFVEQEDECPGCED